MKVSLNIKQLFLNSIDNIDYFLYLISYLASVTEHYPDVEEIWDKNRPAGNNTDWSSQFNLHIFNQSNSNLLPLVSVPGSKAQYADISLPFRR